MARQEVKGTGLALWDVAKRTGMKEAYLYFLCKEGTIKTAQRHPTTKEMRIYPPYLIGSDQGGWRPLLPSSSTTKGGKRG
jgi:hypothetical protein